MMAVEVSGCALERHFWTWPWPQGNLLGTEGRPLQIQRQIMKGLGKGLHSNFSVTLETLCDGQIAFWDHFPARAFCCFYNSCVRGCLGNAIRDVSGFNK